MSPIETLARMGPAAAASPSGETADAAAFEAALTAQGEAAVDPRGGLGAGAEIAAQQSAQAAAGGTTVRRGFLYNLYQRALARSGQGPQPPIICPAEPTMLKPEQPIICHDTATVPKADRPLILPADKPGAGETPLVLPGAPVAAKPADAETPLVLATAGAPVEANLAQGAMLSAQQAVGAAPEITPLALPDEAMVKPEPTTPDLPDVAVTAATTASSATQAGAQPATDATPTAEAKVAEPAKIEGPVDGSLLDELVAGRQDAPEPASAPTVQTTAQTHARADAPLAQRLSFDAVTQISAQILRKLEGKSTRFEMELHPADLGRVDVRLDIDSEGRMAARLSFDNAAAAADLRGRVDDLRRQLEDAGFQLAQDAFSFTERDRSEGQGNDGLGARRQMMARAAETATSIDVSAQSAIRASLRGGLDVRI